jgi:hypothetical protein
MNDWTLKLPGCLRPQVDELARAEFLTPPQFVRQIVQRAVFEKQLERSRQQSK